MNIKKAWGKAEKALKKMSPEEKRDTLVKSGILTRKGHVAKRYRGIFK